MFTNTEAFSGFAVDDLEAARKFYGETLGIRTSEQLLEPSVHGRISSRRGPTGRGA
jgi:catechol 2,3-dioxygenase-like lactoylglutathione lyase family enzyme